ncbi:ATP-dependent protease [Alginatibacterium sediminis]|uniref:ATP-dependent protease n=1 Tax=Alginatibacterium sediminis TaxID=2164068 RepID=A0A420ELG0_9ALTE|nr:YifB family Mg chelatase-like AAA ATPase [Alginatibacterium sediminis]RKF21519.1 ATP-dependent protease [Alginatibacterium sediminis]
MGLATIQSRACVGIDSPLVNVEVHIGNGLPQFNIVGLPEASVREARDRVRSAIINSGFDFPSSRITVNLAPADLPKEGGRFDLAIALGILQAAGCIDIVKSDSQEFVAELALSGELRPVSGEIPVCLAATNVGHQLFIAQQGLIAAKKVPGSEVYGLQHLQQLCAFLQGKIEQPTSEATIENIIALPNYPDFLDVIGQTQAKRALEIAASGGHHLLFIGPPGSGKTMLASRMPSILPSLTKLQAIEVAALYSLTEHRRAEQDWYVPPFRAPHHSASPAALIGGGTIPRPGEISLAHHGVLFLDEMAEAPRQVLDHLRQPLESGKVHISRARAQVEFPAQFQFLAAMNPSPCGHMSGTKLRSNPLQIQRYLSKISGPLLDRFDLSVEVSVPDTAFFKAHLQKPDPNWSSANIRARVVAARRQQLTRSCKLNAHLSGSELQTFAPLSESLMLLFERANQKLELSLRAQHRVWRVARTIADIGLSDTIEREHLLEALNFRAMDKLLKLAFSSS